MKIIDNLPPLKETLKQKIQLKMQRIRRYKKRNKFYRQSTSLKKKKKIYRELGKKKVNVAKPPIKDEIENFWESIWGIEKDCIKNDE